MRDRYERQAAEPTPAPAVEADTAPQHEEGRSAEAAIEPEAAAEVEQPAAARDVDGEIDHALTTAKAALDHIAEQQREAEREAEREEAARAADYDQMRRAEQARQAEAEAEGPQLQR
jgi:hypothetical protein